MSSSADAPTRRRSRPSPRTCERSGQPRDREQRASGVQKKKPCSGETSTWSACGAAPVHLARHRALTARGLPFSASRRAAAAGSRWQTPHIPRARAQCAPTRLPSRPSAYCASERHRPSRAPAPSAKNTSCSRTMAISAPPSAEQRTRRARTTCRGRAARRHEERHRERRAGVRKRRRDVHVEEERRAQPDGESRAELRPSSRRRGGPPRSPSTIASESVERRAVRDRRDIRLANKPSTATSRPAPHVRARRRVRHRIERRPQHRAADRPVVDPPPGRGLALEERLVEIRRLRDAVIVEIPVLVLERHVVIEPERPQIREILDFVRRVQPGRDGGQRTGEQQEQCPSSRRESIRLTGQSADQSGRAYLTANARYFRSCARLNAAWLTIGATMLRRTMYRRPQPAPSRPGHDHRVVPLLAVPEPEKDAVDGHAPPPRRRGTGRSDGR